MKDVNDAKHIEVKVMKSAIKGYTLWVNIDGECVLRVNKFDMNQLTLDLPEDKVNG